MYKSRSLFFVLVLLLAVTTSIGASANSMPADQLMRLSNRELCEKGQTHWDKNEPDSALICFNIVANRADKKQSEEDLMHVFRAEISMANILYSEFDDYEFAVKHLLESEQIALKYNAKEHLADIYELMAVIEGEQNNLLHDFSFSIKSLELHKKAFYMSARNRTRLLSIINMTEDALEHHMLEMIKEELKKFQNEIISDSEPLLYFAKHMTAAASATLAKQYDIALNHLRLLENNLDMVEHMKPVARFIAHSCMFYVYRDKKDHVAALHELDIMELIARENNIHIGVIEVLLHKRDYYSARGNKILADKYDLEYHKAKDKYIADSKLAKVDEEKVLFKLNEANHEIKEMSYKQRIQQTELIAIAVVAVLLLMLLVIGWMSYRRMQEKNQTLYQHNMQLIANENRLRQLHQAEQQPASEPTTKYRRSNMEGEEISLVMSKVDRVMESSPEIYSTDFSLEQLAELTGESRIRLSQAINQVPGRTFYSILNGYRVREACRRMDDKEQYGGLTIEAIAQSVGFKNRSSFVAIFKRITGVTPSAYLKQPTAADSPTPETHADNAEI